VHVLTPALDILAGLVVGWLPGAMLFRAPILDRERRAALDAEERIFWHVVLSLGLSLSVVLALAALGAYGFRWLLAMDVVVSLAIAAIWRGRLRMVAAVRPRFSMMIPLALVGIGIWQFFPPSEYVIGGKDPGVYMNEGIQIAQRGTLVVRDETIAAVPPFARELFLPRYYQGPDVPRTDYYSVRFMGFFIRDADSGAVVGQFPHLFPASIAIGYGIDGLTGARRTVGCWAILGLLSVYFAGARLGGRAVGAGAALLLSVHVLQVWYSRYPSAEIVMQALLFAALLAADRALVEADRFSGVVAGSLLGLMMWLRYDVVLAFAAVGLGIAVCYPLRRSLPWALIIPAAGLATVALLYLMTVMTGYSAYPLGFTRDWAPAPAIGGIALAAALRWIAKQERRIELMKQLFPTLVCGVAIAAAAYAWFLRGAVGRTAIYDAAALRTFGTFYLTPAGVLGAVAGYTYLVSRSFWRAPATYLTICVFALFFFYKIRVVPEHFWMDRRFIAVILPGALLCISGIALAGLRTSLLGRRLPSLALGIVFLVLAARQFARSSEPIEHHVEYAGVIPRLEELARTIPDDQLLLVESRDTSDLHVLALPLAYIYARNVLVFANPVPDKATFERFLGWANTRYRTVALLASGGTDLVSRKWTVVPDESARFTVPEFETTPWSQLPRSVQEKKFDYQLYAFGPPHPTFAATFDLDIGERDDVHVVRFNSKEQTEGRSIRWTGRSSFISTTSIGAGSRILTLWLSDGGRPSGVQPAKIEVYLEQQLIGTATVGRGFRPYEFAIAPALAERAAAADAAHIRIVSNVWSPAQALGTGDTRQLGVMVDRVQVR
jgi:hypothetical protein